MEQELATTATQLPAPTLDQLTLEVKFYLGQTAQNIIEVGKRLAQAKEMLPHGEFGDWLDKNFSLKKSTANNFMRCAERFGNFQMSGNLNSSQMVELLALPADETEAFIEAKAAEGTPVEDMTVKKLREEVEQWKSKAEVNASAVNEKERRISQMASNFNNLQNEKAQLQRDLDDAHNQLKNQKPVIQPPADYEQTKRDLARLRDEKATLQKKLAAAVRNVEVPADYHANKKRLAELDAKIAEMQKQIDTQVSAEDYANVAQKLDAIYALITDIGNSPNVGKVVADYERNNPERYSRLCAKFSDFIRIMEME